MRHNGRTSGSREYSRGPPARFLICYGGQHCTLKSLIASKGVSRRWRHLVPLADIIPERRALLELYLDLISSEVFIETRPWTLANLRPFDRQDYVAVLLRQYGHLPEAYRLWILEWPARAVIGCCWPGLPFTECTRSMADGVKRREGWNWLGFMPSQVTSLSWEHWTSPSQPGQLSDPSPVLAYDRLPGILVWTDPYSRLWLVLDQREGKHNKVYELDGDEDILRGVDGYHLDLVHLGWVEWQRSMWGRIEATAENGLTRRPRTTFGRRVHRPPRFATRIPARPWNTSVQVLPALIILRHNVDIAPKVPGGNTFL